MLLQARVLWPEPQFCRGTTGEDGPDGRSHDVADEKLAELWNGCTRLVFVEYAPPERGGCRSSCGSTQAQAQAQTPIRGDLERGYTGRCWHDIQDTP